MKARALLASGWATLFGAYVTVTLVYFRPPLGELDRHIVPHNAGDPLFNLYLLEWVSTRIREGVAGLWSPPFFYPTQGVLAYADHLIGPGLATAVMGTLGVPTTASYNLLVLLSFPLSALTTAWVLRRCGTSLWAAALGGAAYAFSPFRWEQINHLQILLAQWIPLTLWLWDRLLVSPAIHRALFFIAAYALHLSGGTYLSYMIHVPLLVVLLYRARDRWPGWIEGRSWRILGPAGVACVLLLALFYLPYLEQSRSIGLDRSPEEIRSLGATLASLFTPSYRAPYWSELFERYFRVENSRFFGLIATLLVLAGVASARLRPLLLPRRPTHRWMLAAALLLVGGAVIIADLQTWGQVGRGGRAAARALELGNTGAWLPAAAGILVVALLAWRWGLAGSWGTIPAGFPRALLLASAVTFLLMFPLVYLPATQVLPGLAGMRVPTRFYAFASLGLAYLAALGADALRRRARSPGVAATITLALPMLLLLEAAPRPLPWPPLHPRAEFPSSHHWLASAPDVAAFIELPFGAPVEDSVTMYHQTLHWVPMANGYSGHFPAPYVRLRNCCDWRALGDEQLLLLQETGMSHILLRFSKMERWEGELWPAFDARYAEELGWLEAVYWDDEDIIYRIVGVPAEAREGGGDSGAGPLR